MAACVRFLGRLPKFRWGAGGGVRDEHLLDKTMGLGRVGFVMLEVLIAFSV